MKNALSSDVSASAGGHERSPSGLLEKNEEDEEDQRRMEAKEAGTEDQWDRGVRSRGVVVIEINVSRMRTSR